MTEIRLTTHIKALSEVCFDLSRSVTVHKQSVATTQERIVGGISTGLMELGDTVTWEANHLGKKRQLTVRMAEMNNPVSFTDEMVRGSFKSMRHEHYFKPIENGTLMIDIFRYETPYGIIGKLVDKLVLKKHMQTLLKERNAFIKSVAESKSGWKQYLTF